MSSMGGHLADGPKFLSAKEHWVEREFSQNIQPNVYLIYRYLTKMLLSHLTKNLYRINWPLARRYIWPSEILSEVNLGNRYLGDGYCSKEICQTNTSPSGHLTRDTSWSHVTLHGHEDCVVFSLRKIYKYRQIFACNYIKKIFTRIYQVRLKYKNDR